MTMSQRFSASMSKASCSLVSFFAIDGAAPPALEVEKNTGSISAKSPSACMRSINTEPTMPRQPTNPTSAISVLPFLDGPHRSRLASPGSRGWGETIRSASSWW